MSSLSRETAQHWIDRWERQQLRHLPDREERFTALIDAVEEMAGEAASPLVLDLGCGPGSLSLRLIRRIPSATVIALDLDPVLLALGEAITGDVDSIRFINVDLSVPHWSHRLELPRDVDVAVSTTALHWIPAPKLPGMYKELAAILRPNGVLLNGDELILDPDTAPNLAALERKLVDFEERRRFPEGHPENWTQCWDAIFEEPELADAIAERERRHITSDHHGTGGDRYQAHIEALAAAGFEEIGTIWQRGENKLLCAVLNR